MKTIAVRADNLGKCYQIYEKPADRLKQSLWRGKKCFYKEFWAVRNLSFEIAKGETVGIIGANGSGKSTLLQMICGILNPSTGSLEIDGRIAALLELGAGFNPEFTGRENVLMNAASMGLSRSEIKERYNDIAAFADIGHFIDRPVKTYSSGMYVRLAFATAVNVSPDILVVDEALAVGDARFQQKCMAKIKAFCQSGTVILVSHDMIAMLELCSRVIWIESGEIRMDGIPKFVIEKYLQYMYEGTVAMKYPDSEPSASSGSDRHDMSGFQMIDKNIRQFGDKRATIKALRICSPENGNGVIYSGKSCEISMIVNSNDTVSRPIVGFFVKDRLGREIMGDSSLLLGQDIPPFSRDKNYLFSFEIKRWPNLQEGDYALCVAIADGTQEDHVQCHFLHDALIFRSIPVRTPAGIFSVSDSHVTFAEL